MKEQIYLQIDRETTAVIAATTVPEESIGIDLVKVSEEEYLFLDLLSSELPSGWVVSLDDLDKYRLRKQEAADKARSERVQSLLAQSAKVPEKATSTPPESAAEKSSKASNTQVSPSKEKARNGFKHGKQTPRIFRFGPTQSK